MLDNIFSSVKRGAEKVQRRGEEVAHSARLRLEIYQLARELDSLYARLGRAYHAGADPAVLEGLREDVRRLNEEIAARERLVAELGEAEGETQTQTHREAVHAAAARTRAVDETVPAVPPPVNLTKDSALERAAEPNLGDLPDLGWDAGHPVPPSDAPTGAAPSNAPKFVEHQSPPPRLSVVSAASRIWRAKEEERMNDDTENLQTGAVPVGSSEMQASQQVDPVGPNDEAVMTDMGKKLPPRTEEYSGVGDEAERDHMRRHPFMLEEGEKAARNPDPLDK